VSAIRIATRGSALAMAQAHLAAAALARQGEEATLVIVETAGDRRAPDTAWGEGAFVKALEVALLDGRADVAVHSAKDVPTDEDERLEIAAYLPRADPRDALVVAGAGPASIDDLPAGARVGTDSPRRAGFLLAHRPDLSVRPLHGNVDTRLRRLDGGEADALVLACAGLDRLGLQERIGSRLAPDILPPAAGQGAIALQAARGDRQLLERLAVVDDPPTRLAVEAERALLAAAGGGCRAPIGVFAVANASTIELLAGHVEPDGSNPQIGRRSGRRGDAATLVAALYAELWPAPVVLEAV
jgi:hydroxymethylbilane synthase